MKVQIVGTTCSLGCMYATGPIGTCKCSCKGASHGMISQKHLHAIKCSPAAEKRCKEGNEDGECTCACGGMNHGLYRCVENFDKIPILTYAA